ncbi:DUF4865 family protein [Noviherbaspirillum denitrificans]|uniref:D-amino acid aminotransferase n=1 Tax=Noviherbaspirillum denitrificans TaxID=1968433 RepID=A0A254T6N5_9BURK|nr:DUF4865 family protein [Noviherbaspirillum denitrificans]OWW18311.1 D-amino acid aminotransferase [Noviherbaspirillum denitrificans]
MIAMQYSLVLPADYDMAIIDRRIAERGHLTDGFPGLAFKAYLHARKPDMAGDNLYAPFYLWRTTEGMNEFLCGPGFAGLTQSFGWPSVRTWSVWDAEMSEAIAEARYAVRETVSIPPHSDLAALRRAEIEGSREMLSGRDVLATLAGFDPMNWCLVRFQLMDKTPDRRSDGQTQVYGVGHVSTGCVL